MSERWRLIAGWTPEPWLALLLALAALIALIDAWQGLRRPALPLERRQRVALFGLRLLGITALAAVVSEATIAIEEVSPTGPRVVVLVDRSASMALADADSPGAAATPRIERIRALWAASADARTRWQADGLAVEVRTFARASEPLASAAIDALAVEADGGASDLTRALVELGRTRDAGEGRPLAGVVVLSDGLVAADVAAEAPLRSAASELGVPLTTVAAGAPAIRDLGIRRVMAGEFAFVENVTELGAEVVAHGYAGQAIAVDLERDGEVIATVEALAPADGEAMPIRFEVAPDRIGHFVYAIAIRPQEGEATLVNNRWSFVVKVLRDKVRVLHVAGRPDWDVRALRTLLGRDPNVELLSYYILRGLDDSDREDPTAPLSLIAFPTDQLFSEELGSFDLVILHNFDARSHQVGRYLGDVADYVSEGGALVMIGGDLGLATGDYAGSLGRVVPVMVDRPTGLDTAPFRPVVAEPGRRHPITAWLTDPRLGGWEGLPALDSFNSLRLSGDASLQATALLRHPDGPPLLAVAEAGKGRSVVLATGASWRLGFAADLPLIDGARPYDLLWLGIIRWLLRDAAAERLSLEVAEPTLAPGEAIDLRAAALSTSYAPEPGVEIEWALRPLAPPPAEGAPPIPAIARGTWTTDALGRASERVPPPPPAPTRSSPAAGDRPASPRTRRSPAPAGSSSSRPSTASSPRSTPTRAPVASPSSRPRAAASPSRPAAAIACRPRSRSPRARARGSPAAPSGSSHAARSRSGTASARSSSSPSPSAASGSSAAAGASPERPSRGDAFWVRLPAMSAKTRDPKREPQGDEAASEAADKPAIITPPPRVSRHIQPLGPRILVRLVRSPDRSESGLFLPVGAKESHAEALLGEVIEVARTMPKAGPVLDDDDDDDDDDDARKADLGENVSGIPVGAQVLFPKDQGLTVPWDETLRLLEVRHVLALVETITQDELQ